MATELEALVGHLFVVGGRALTAASPGAVATSPPRRTARGRDLDTFFGLVTLVDQPGEPAVFYERLSNLISQQYYDNSGSITAALREAVATANASLLAENMNREQPTFAGYCAAVLRGSEAIVACMGKSRAFLLRSDIIERLPTDEETQQQSPPLGARETPSIRFYRREVRSGDMLFLTDGTLDEVSDGEWRQLTASRDVESSLHNLREAGGAFTSAMIIQFVVPLTEEEAQAEQVAEVAAQQAAEQMAAQEVAKVAARRAARQQAEAAQHELEAAPPARQRPSVAAGGMLRGGLRRGAISVAGLASGLRGFVERAMPEDPSGGRRLSVSAQIVTAVAIPIVVALLATGVYILRGEASQYSALVSDAMLEMEQARAAGTDQAAARPHWESAVFLLQLAEQVRPEDPSAPQLIAEANGALDFYDNVTRVPLTPLREYAVGARLDGPIVRGTDLYVIDQVSNVLYREVLDENGVNVVGRDPEVITRQSELVGSQTVGGLVDLIWMEEGGVPQRNVLAVLTDNGLLLTYSPTWALTASVLPGGQDMTSPRATATYAGNYYVLDPEANQIWRYEAVGDTYPDLPTPYFTETFPDLTGAIDMDIDANGNVFVLFEDGRLNKYFSGRQEGFSLQGMPQPVAQASAFFIDTNPFSPAFYIGDPAGERIFQTTTTGVFSRNYKSAEGRQVLALTGIFADGSTNSVYVAAGNSLYRFTRP